MTRLTTLLAVALLADCTPPAPEPVEAPQAPGSWEEGTYVYVAPLQGQSIIADGRFVFLYGPADGSGPMTGAAGTYVLSGDTVTNTVTYSTDPAAIGTGYRWVMESMSGDTLTYVTMTLEGQPTGRGRSVKVRWGASEGRDPGDDRAALDQLRREHVRGVNARDADLVLAGMAGDVVYLGPDLAPAVGRAALDSIIRPAYEQIQPEITMTPTDVSIQGDVAVEWGCLGGRILPLAGGDPIGNRGKYLFVYRWRRDTGWRITHDIYNSGPCDG